MKKYGVTLRYVERKSGEVSLTAFIGQAEKNTINYGEVAIVVVTLIALIVYLAYFTVIRYRNTKKDKE